MKLFVKLMLLIVVLALAAPFILKGPDGRPLMQLSDLKLGEFEFPTFGRQDSATTTVHRWQDDNGEWHYSNEAPQQTSETLEINPNVNIMDAPKRQVRPAVQPAQSQEPQAPTEPLKPSILNPGSLKDAVDETRAVREQLEQRQRDIQQQIDNQ